MNGNFVNKYMIQNVTNIWRDNILNWTQYSGCSNNYENVFIVRIISEDTLMLLMQIFVLIVIWL